MSVKSIFSALLAMSAMSVAAFPLTAHATAAAVMAMHDIVNSVAAAPLRASALPPFPVTKVSSSVTPGAGRHPSTVKVTYRSTVPGLSFCIGYAGAHGAIIPYGYVDGESSDAEHCVIAGRDGLVQDHVFINVGTSPDALLIATIVLIDNRVSTETVPLGATIQKAQ